jgi:hypothetical protein
MIMPVNDSSISNTPQRLCQFLFYLISFILQGTSPGSSDQDLEMEGIYLRTLHHGLKDMIAELPEGDDITAEVAAIKVMKDGSKEKREALNKLDKELMEGGHAVNAAVSARASAGVAHGGGAHGHAGGVPKKQLVDEMNVKARMNLMISAMAGESRKRASQKADAQTKGMSVKESLLEQAANEVLVENMLLAAQRDAVRQQIMKLKVGVDLQKELHYNRVEMAEQEMKDLEAMIVLDPQERGILPWKHQANIESTIQRFVREIEGADPISNERDCARLVAFAEDLEDVLALYALGGTTEDGRKVIQYVIERCD